MYTRPNGQPILTKALESVLQKGKTKLEALVSVRIVAMSVCVCTCADTWTHVYAYICTAKGNRYGGRVQREYLLLKKGHIIPLPTYICN